MAKPRKKKTALAKKRAKKATKRDVRKRKRGSKDVGSDGSKRATQASKTPKPKAKVKGAKAKAKRGTRGVSTPRKPARGPGKSAEVSESIPSLDPDVAMATIRDRLERANEIGRVRVWPYADGSIDGEVLAKLPRGKSASDVLLELEELIGRDGLDGMWVNVGVRYTIKEDEEVYRRFRGFNDVNTHYQRAIATNVAEVFVIGRHEIAAGMENKYGRKADSVYIRIHWNPEGTKPLERETAHEE